MPLAPPELSDGADVPISFLQCGRRPWTQLGVAPRWEKHPHSLSLTLRVGGFVDALGIVGTIWRAGSYTTVDPLEQDGNPSAIKRSTTGQIRGNDLASVRVYREMQFPPSPFLRWRSQIADVNPETCTVDEQVDRSITRHRIKRNLTERPEPPRQSRVIGNGDLHLKLVCQRSQEAFGLPERKVGDQTGRQSRLNREIRVDALAAGSATGWCPPRVDGVVGKPNGEVAASA